ncbi:hypothetical protein Tco_0961857, partial [Tanacetum coccineum]
VNPSGGLEELDEIKKEQNALLGKIRKLEDQPRASIQRTRPFSIRNVA